MVIFNLTIMNIPTQKKQPIHPRHLMVRMKEAREMASSQSMSNAEFLRQCPEEVRVQPLIKKEKKLIS